MVKLFNNKKIELLAPAGTMDTFKQMVMANCDAIYIGGQSLNMRMMRKGYNFSNQEIAEAIKMAHSVDKKVYITVNNMINENEIAEATDYLHFLNNSAVDGIIVQDLGVLQICRDEKLSNLEIHASIMMNVHNIETVKALQEHGVTRVILSREMELKTAKNLQNMTGIETEYFIHGDMCIGSGANCYFSSTVFGNSSNRGRCYKPCRWNYTMKHGGKLYQTKFPLAAKDMFMYEHIPELIEACITSFKIEGRMRDTDFIVNLVNTYGDAIDRYIDDPLSFDRKQSSDKLHETRKRDFSTAYAFENPGLDFINTRYEGTGKFYSTGKVFSTPTEEPELTETSINDVRAILESTPNTTATKPKLSIKVNNYEQAKLCLDLRVDRIYIPTEVFQPDTVINIEQLKQLRLLARQTEIYLDLPQMMNEQQFDVIDQYLALHGELFDGLLVSSLGAIHRYAQKHPVITNFNMNIYNHKATEFYHNAGAKELTLSIETKTEELVSLLKKCEYPMEMIVHGPIKIMYLEHNLYENVPALEPTEKSDNKFVNNNVLVLITGHGENPVYIDQSAKNHLFSAKEFCALPLLDRLNGTAPINFRIEGQTYSLAELKEIITTYQAAIADMSQCGELFRGMKSVKAGLTLGALGF